MAEKKDNLELWNRVQETDPKYTKVVNQRGGFTSINAQYQIMTATKEFGVYGQGWGIKDINYEYITAANGDILAVAKVLFFYPEGSFPISSAIIVSKGERIDDEFAKKLETDITTKALSKLGFSADVFLGRYDDNRYINDMKEKFKPEVKKAELQRAQYEAVMKALETANEKSLAGIKDKMSKYGEGRYLKLAMKGIANKESALSKHPVK